MTAPPPPLRFLVVVIGGWTIARGAILSPGWRPEDAAVQDAVPLARAVAQAAAPPLAATTARTSSKRQRIEPQLSARAPLVRPGAAIPIAIGAAPEQRIALEPTQEAEPPPLAVYEPGPLAASQPRPSAPRRWSLSAWSFLRGGEGSSLAAGGTLGGSQAGLRATYRLGRGLALSARLSGPLRRPTRSEAALGVDLAAPRLPVHLLIERRQAIGRGGRSAFGAIVYGGVSEKPLGPFRLDGYGQAGLVGARSRDLFADGGATIALPLTRRLRLGAGAWAAAQPGVSRADVGPRASFGMPLGGRSVTVAADWRMRVAGNARPGSGPALTLASDF
jgi:hypothetical protein